MLERTWRKHFSALSRLAQSIVHDPSLSDDILQDAYARVLRSGPQFQTEKDAYCFLRRAVFNAAIDHYRYSRRRKGLCRLTQLNLEYTNQVCDSSANPLEQILDSEKRRLHRALLHEVRKELALLPAEQRQAIRVVFGRNGEKMALLCNQLGIPYSTLRSRMLRGVDQIRKRLRRRGLLPCRGKEER